jgi:ABC-type glycerol-3-phosphate transport system substrate-binding protein|tara:strand:+ start:193 stop:351 length:159 start_codon:yes stop_codon:yes gene_type:complete
MKNILIAIALLGMLSACSIGQKCTYTQEGTKIKSWVWFYKDKPADLDKENCN